MEILSKLPNSELKDTLLFKYKGVEKRYEELLTELQNVSLTITREIRNIDLLFPEYTPHDLDYHISHLFLIADKLLGAERYNEMNFMELYLLVIAIYAHDWGMAVSNDERESIIHEEVSSEFDLLEGEKAHFEEFLISKIGNIECDKDKLDISIWQEYIRKTHALRSGKRIQSHFKKVNGSVADACQKLCVGHWLDIADINEKNGYYTDDSVSGEVVNLKALTIYIRLIDLFDLAEDRTPYVIWKYINPKNPYSKMEWEKHRALHQVTCPSYEKGRVILVRGSTDDHEVYASIMDLKNLCDRYFRECLDALAHMKDNRHELGVYFIDWRIEPINFTPLSIQFDFNRENIFEVLSQEIYNFHPYVYIRELLQNSVDAITFRKEVLSRCGVGGDNVGRINVNISQVVNGEFDITVSDDGIGMDEYVLKNYFSVLGKSYYRSNDFKKRHLDMSPISRFGVGVLSCFAIADSMEIITAREPYLGGESQGLRVVIKDIERQFRIEKIPAHMKTIGTAIKLKVKTNALEKLLLHKGMEISDYNITDYIKKIAGFLPYPVILNEKGKKTIVVHPENEIEKQKSFIEGFDEYEHHKLAKIYDEKGMVVFQDVSNFKKIFSSRSIDVVKDLKMNNIEGVLNFAILKNDNTRIINPTSSWPTDEIKVITEDKESYRIRWSGSRKDLIKRKKHENRYEEFLKIFNNGFWLEHENKRYHDFRSHLFPKPIIRVNHLNSEEQISVSRFESICNDSQHVLNDTDSSKKKTIIDKVWLELTKYLGSELIAKQENMKEYEFLRLFATYALAFHLSSKDFDSVVLNEVKLPHINEKGELYYCNVKNRSILKLLPSSQHKEVAGYFYNGRINDELKDWKYGDCLLMINTGGFMKTIGEAIDNAIHDILIRDFFIRKIDVSDIIVDELPIVQEIWEKNYKRSKIEYISTLLKSYVVKDTVSEDEIESNFDDVFKLSNIVEFDINFNKNFAYGNKYFNIEHPLTVILIKYSYLIRQAKKNNSDELRYAEVNDLFFDLPFFKPNSNDKSKVFSFSEINSQLKRIHNKLEYFYDDLKIDEYDLTCGDFVSGTIVTIEDDEFYFIEKFNRYYYGYDDII